MPKKGSDLILKAALVVIQNDASKTVPGGIVKLTIPEEELKRVNAEEDLIKKNGGRERSLDIGHVTLIFRDDEPMLDFPESGDDLATQGYELRLYKLPKFTKTQRKSLGILTPAERREERRKEEAAADQEGEA